jgi:tRNA-modifying protein YgfZ
MTSIDTLGADYRAITGSCGVLDRSERGKLALSGADTRTFLQGQVSNDVEGLVPGTGCYAAFLTPKGKMLGDLRILDAGEELLLDTERVALQPLFNMIRHFSIGYRVELHKRTLERGLLSLIGPASPALAGVVALAGAPEHANAPVQIDGVAVLAVRTDLGIDLLCESAATERLRDALVARGAVAVGEQAAEIVRVHSGRPRYGVDIDDTTIPQEAGLNERAVSFTKGCYVGQETVARLYYKGKPNRHLRGLRLSAPAAAGEPLRLGEREVGSLGSSVGSPELGPIALALVRREAEPGARLEVGEHGAQALVVELPFATGQPR